MVYKLFIEEGEFRDRLTKEARNIMEAPFAMTPEGLNVGWDEFNSLEEAMYAYNVEYKPKED